MPGRALIRSGASAYSMIMTRISGGSLKKGNYVPVLKGVFLMATSIVPMWFEWSNRLRLNVVRLFK